jgi:hypothetical protein
MNLFLPSLCGGMATLAGISYLLLYFPSKLFNRHHKGFEQDDAHHIGQ